MHDRYWTRCGCTPPGVWNEVDKAAYVAFERANGFYNSRGEPGEPATTSFSRSGDCGLVQGTQINPLRAGRG